MGLSLIEFTLAVEKEFDITIPDEESVRLNSVRIVVDYLMSRPEIGGKWSREHVTLTVWMILEDQTGIVRENFNEDSRFIEDMEIN